MFKDPIVQQIRTTRKEIEQEHPDSNFFTNTTSNYKRTAKNH